MSFTFFSLPIWSFSIFPNLTGLCQYLRRWHTIMDHWKVDKPMDLRAQLRNQHKHCKKPFGETKGTESWAGELEIGKRQGLTCEKWGGGCWQCPSPTCTHYPRDLAAWPLALMGIGITRARVRWKTKGDSRAPPNFTHQVLGLDKDGCSQIKAARGRLVLGSSLGGKGRWEGKRERLNPEANPIP